MRLHLEYLSTVGLFMSVFMMISVLYALIRGTLATQQMRDLATGIAFAISIASLSITTYNQWVIIPRFVDVDLSATGEVANKRYRIVAQVMNIGGRFADKCTCEVMRIVDGKRMSLEEGIQLDFVPVDTPVGKLEPLSGSQTFSMPPNTRIYLRNYISESLREHGKRNLILKLDANGHPEWSHEFGLPDWSDMVAAQNRSIKPLIQKET